MAPDSGGSGGALGTAGSRAEGGSSAAPGGGASTAGGASAGTTQGGTTQGGGSSGRASSGGASGGSAGASIAGAGSSIAGSSTGGSAAAGAAAGGRSGGSGAAGTTGTAGGGAGGATGAAGAGNLTSVSVYIAGDSTVSQYVLDPQNAKSQAGWGQMLGAYYTTKATVLDKAVGGRTARRYIQEGTLDAILKVIKPGDYLLVQFGTNDSNTSATYTLSGVDYPYYAAAATDFKTYLQQYIDGALSKQAIPVLVTPPPRNSAYCNGARSLANYGQAMIELGKAYSVAVVDLGLKTHAYLSAVCPKPASGSQEMFFKVNADSTIDGTHFQENGARIMAGFVADGIAEAKLGLAAYRKP